MKTLIKNGLVYDGSGVPPVRREILIEDDAIVRIAPQIEAGQADEIVDAAGKIVTPGFIDLHRHCDIMPFVNPDFGKIELAQGITTAFVGNCGLAPVPAAAGRRRELYDYLEPVIGTMPAQPPAEGFEDYAEALARARLPINMGFFAGSDSIKIAVKGFGREPYSEPELALAQDYVHRALVAGAFGLTFGIMYQPECYSSRGELIRVAEAASGRGALLCTHIRGEGDSLVESVEEVIEIAEKAGVSLNISHFKATGISNWGNKIALAISRIEAARARGQDVTADFYPYTGGSTTLQSLLPPTMMAASGEELAAALSAPEGKTKLKKELNRHHPGWDNMAKSIGWERILISSVTLEKNKFMQGKNIKELAAGLGYREEPDFVADLLAQERGKAAIIVLSMSSRDVDTVARLPYTMLISDALYGGDSRYAHPRLWGTTARFLQDFVQKRKVLPMEQAIHKMTGLPAKRVGLLDRGLLREGYKADVLVFKPETFQDHADYTAVPRLCSGMELVFLAGRKAVENGVPIDLSGGRLLKK